MPEASGGGDGREVEIWIPFPGAEPFFSFVSPAKGNRNTSQCFTSKRHSKWPHLV